MPTGSDGKESACNAGDLGLTPGSESPEKGKGYPLQYSCLGNPMDRGVWQATVHGVKVSDTTEQMRQKHENTPSTINRILFLFFPEGTPLDPASSRTEKTRGKVTSVYLSCRKYLLGCILYPKEVSSKFTSWATRKLSSTIK